MKKIISLGMAAILTLSVGMCASQKSSTVKNLLESLSQGADGITSKQAFCNVAAEQLNVDDLSILPKNDRITLYIACKDHWSGEANQKKLAAVSNGVKGNQADYPRLTTSEKVSPVRRAVIWVAEGKENACRNAGKLGRGLKVLDNDNARILDVACADVFSKNGDIQALRAVVRDKSRLEAFERTATPKSQVKKKKAQSD